LELKTIQVNINLAAYRRLLQVWLPNTVVCFITRQYFNHSSNEL